MTKKKVSGKPNQPSTLERMQHLRQLGLKISDGKKLTIQEEEYLGKALVAIAGGAEPKQSLGIKPQKGEKVGIDAKQAENRRRLAISWIKTAILPAEEGGLGLTLSEAIEKIGDVNNQNPPFGLSEETLKNKWRDGNLNVDIIFPLLD